MLFNSWTFAVFFALFYPVFLLVRTHVRARNVWLLLASYFFYGWWNPRFVPLLAILAAVDYLAALGVAGKPVTHFDRAKGVIFTLAATVACAAAIGADGPALLLVVAGAVAAFVAFTYLIALAPAQRRPRLWLFLSVFANLGVLAYFKYCNFFVDSIESALAALGWHIDTFTLSVILPIGLSFHVFQGLSRTIDCYRGVIKPEGSLTTVATYLAFFPQLVAGPIERASHLIPQFETVRPLSRQQFATGSLLFLWGLYQKLVIADNVAPLANHAFANAASIDAATAAAGVMAFTVQIYCDFCGYSNMARGLARCLGFDLMANFNLPYFSRTPSEFWRRWHISLSSWLRDYLYFGLGGNRGGGAKTYRNLMITMLLGGLWHGAAWTFVIWGAFHGAILVAYRALNVDALLERTRVRGGGFTAHVLAWVVTMTLVMIGWIFFRAQSLGEAIDMLMAFSRGGSADGAFRPLLIYAAPLALVEIYQRWANRPEVFAAGPFLLRYTAVVTVFMMILLASAPTGQDFIYFDF